MRSLLTGGSPADSFLDEDLVGLFKLGFVAGPRFSHFEIILDSDDMNWLVPTDFFLGNFCLTNVI